MKRTFRLLCIFSLFVIVTDAAFARMGGGHSYSGGHSSGGGGYSGGGGGGDGGFIFDLIYILFRLIFEFPIIGIPLLLFICYIVYKSRNRHDDGSNSEINSMLNTQSTSPQYDNLFQNVSSSRELDGLRARDPNFSRALFMDFIYALFAHVHSARGQRHLDDYSNYLAASVIEGLKTISVGLSGVEGVVIGAASILEVGVGERTEIKIEFQANYTEISNTAASQSWFVTERWTLVRDAKVLSRTPDQAQALKCPSCGAPLAETRNGRCGSCGQSNTRGQFDWFVQARDEVREKREPLLTSNVPEEGTNLPTLYDPDLTRETADLAARIPDYSWPAFEKRVRHVFLELQKAWTERRWELARPYESDSLFQTHLYWISAYQRQKLVNALKDIQVEKVLLVKVKQDRFYASVTVRVYASMIDYTAKANGGEIVSGSVSRSRRFSEYWTFIRSQAAPQSKSGPTFSQCPSCGAPLKITMAGVCEFCQTKVTTGQFDWVLSEIEQDEAYAG